MLWTTTGRPSLHQGGIDYKTASGLCWSTRIWTCLDEPRAVVPAGLARRMRVVFRVSGFGFRVSGFGFRVSGIGLRVEGKGRSLRVRAHAGGIPIRNPLHTHPHGRLEVLPIRVPLAIGKRAVRSPALIHVVPIALRFASIPATRTMHTS